MRIRFYDPVWEDTRTLSFSSEWLQEVAFLLVNGFFLLDAERAQEVLKDLYCVDYKIDRHCYECGAEAVFKGLFEQASTDPALKFECSNPECCKEWTVG